MDRDRKFLSKRVNENCSTKAITAGNELAVRSPRFEPGNEVQVSGHSTPFRHKGNHSALDASPEVDHGYSPILLPCTQDSNEIAWDWQNNSIKSKESWNKNNLAETPKRSKLLHTKRTTNSPLLQKKLKRKLGTDNIEELAAELKALTEGIYSAKQNEEAQFCQEMENKDSDPQLLMVLDTIKDGIALNVSLNNNKVNGDTSSMNSGNNECNKIESYDDLFDDSIDDSMVKCSQAVEERLNLDLKKCSDLLSANDNQFTQGPLSSSKNSTGSSCSSSFSKNSPRMNVSSCLKTYSKTSVKGNTSINSGNAKDRHLPNYQLKNNSISTTKVQPEKMISASKLSVETTSDILTIPDDSFDDCLATCIETEKLLAKTSDLDDIFLNINMNNLDTVHKGNSTENSSVAQMASGSRKSLTIIPMENRKFFKTKSLSDQNFTKTGKTTYAPKSSYSNNQGRLHAGSSVTTTHSAAKLTNSHQTSSINEKETNSRFTKYKSTSNLSYTKESSKEGQPAICTREEIERKRMEAKMRLSEAKRKLQQSASSGNNQLEIPLKRPVKR